MVRTRRQRKRGNTKQATPGNDPIVIEDDEGDDKRVTISSSSSINNVISNNSSSNAISNDNTISNNNNNNPTISNSSNSSNTTISNNDKNNLTPITPVTPITSITPSVAEVINVDEEPAPPVRTIFLPYHDAEAAGAHGQKRRHAGGENSRALNKRYRQDVERNLSRMLEQLAGVDGAQEQQVESKEEEAAVVVRVARRVVSAEEGRASVMLPTGLAALLKEHQLEGIRFCWSRIVEPVMDHLKGCILAHSMGLGKTLQMVSFVHLFSSENKGKHVLILCPKNVILNWPNEFEKWTGQAKILEIPVYCFSDKVKTPEDRIQLLQKWADTGGVVIISFTTYYRLVFTKPIHANDTKPVIQKKQELYDLSDKVLANPGPDLVIIDEASALRNKRTNFVKALEKVRTRQRIVLTGTPLQNNLNELKTLVDFVKPGYWLSGEFDEHFTMPIYSGINKDASSQSVEQMKKASFLLAEDLKNYVHRKDQSVLVAELPKKNEFVILVRINEFQRSLYKSFLHAHRFLSARKDILYFCSMLHKIVNHPDLLKVFCKRHKITPRIPHEVVENMPEEDQDEEEDEKEEDILNMSLLSSGTSSSSRNSLTQSLGTPRSSLPSEMKMLQQGNEEDEASRQQLLENLDEDNVDNIDEMGKFYIGYDYSWAYPVLKDDYVVNDIQNSAKLKILFAILEGCLRNAEKILVFSQFTETLDMIENVLKNTTFTVPIIEGMDYQKRIEPGKHCVRIDGKTSMFKREQLIRDFNNKEECFVFLISVKAGAMGINLTAATRVVLFDVPWDPTWLNQAIFRVYRYGQTKPVTIYRLIGAGTIEESIWNRCIAKTWLFKRIVDDKIPIRLLAKEDFNLHQFDSAQNKPPERVDQSLVSRDEEILQKIFHRPELRSLIHNITEHESLYIEDHADKLSDREKEEVKRNLKSPSKVNSAIL